LGALLAGVVGSTAGAYLRPEVESVATGRFLVASPPPDSSLGHFDGPVWPGDDAAFE
jgi:hypothetical protein